MTSKKTHDEDGDEGLPIVNIDASIENADWTKQSWDLPPYKSQDFFVLYPPEELPEFRKSIHYKNAVARGLIHDDEWVDNHVRKIIQKE